MSVSISKHLSLDYSNIRSIVMSLDNYGQFQNQGQPEGAGTAPPQNGGAPGQQSDQVGPPQMQFAPQDGQGMTSPAPGQEGKTTLW